MLSFMIIMTQMGKAPKVGSLWPKRRCRKIQEENRVSKGP